MSQSSSTGGWALCPKCNLYKLQAEGGVAVDKHDICQECLGQHHEPSACTICTSMPKKLLAKRELVRAAWIHSGEYMSRSKAAAYLKGKGLDMSFREQFNLSFQALTAPSLPSFSAGSGQVPDTSPGVLPQILSYGPSVTGKVLPQGPGVPHSVGVPEANSTADSLGSLFNESSQFPAVAPSTLSSQLTKPAASGAAPPSKEESSTNPSLVKDITESLLKSLAPLFKQPFPVPPVQEPQSSAPQPPAPPASTAGSDKSSDVSEEAVDLHKVQALNAICEDLAPLMNLEVADRFDSGPKVRTLSLFLGSKPKKATLFKAPPEFLERDKFLMEHRFKKDLVPPQSKRILRLDPLDWAKVYAGRKPDDILISRSKTVTKSVVQSGKFVTLADKDKAEDLKFCRNLSDAAAHTFRLASVGASTSQFVLSSLEKILADEALPSGLKSKLQSVQAASQVSLSAAAEISEVASRQKSAASFRERDIWLKGSSLPKDVKEEAMDLPFPEGHIDPQGNLVPPKLLGDQFKELLSSKYKDRKYADKVAPVKRSAPFPSKQPAKKARGSSSSSGSSFKKKKSGVSSPRGRNNQPFRGRGGRGGKSGRGRGAKSKSDS